MPALFTRTGEIDGFTSVQAVRRSLERTKNTQVSSTSKESTGHGEGGAYHARLARTSVPPRYNIQCYECGFSFVHTGILKDTLCPRCHVMLDASYHKIETECPGVIKTIGIVELNIACGSETTIVAGELILYADASSASLQVQRKLEVYPGGNFFVANTSASHIIIRNGAHLLLNGILKCSTLTVQGTVEGELNCNGLVIIERGGLITGSLICPRLSVQDGGGLLAKVSTGISQHR